jgi:two-component system OmpR family sensor kinase
MSTRRALSADAQLIRRTAFRAGLQSALAVALTVVVLCGVAVLVLLRSQHSQQSSLLDSTIARADDVSDPPADMWLVIQHGAQRSVSPGLPDGLPDERALAATAVDGATRAEDVHAGPREYRVTTQRRGDEVVQGILDLRSAHEERDRMLQALLVTGLVGLLLAGTAGAWLGRRAPFSRWHRHSPCSAGSSRTPATSCALR